MIIRINLCFIFRDKSDWSRALLGEECIYKSGVIKSWSNAWELFSFLYISGLPNCVISTISSPILNKLSGFSTVTFLPALQYSLSVTRMRPSLGLVFSVLSWDRERQSRQTLSCMKTENIPKWHSGVLRGTLLALSRSFLTFSVMNKPTITDIVLAGVRDGFVFGVVFLVYMDSLE